MYSIHEGQKRVEEVVVVEELWGAVKEAFTFICVICFH